MPKVNLAVWGFLALVLIMSCRRPINDTVEGKDKLEAQSIERMPNDLSWMDTTYIAIYSDIYVKSEETKFNLTATLSLRNTDFRDTIYISEVQYFNSAGDKIRDFIQNPILVKPMQSIEYVIEEEDTTGGSGANFIVIWGARNASVKPIFEGIMISTHGQQGISFSTQGVSIKREKSAARRDSVE